MSQKSEIRTRFAPSPTGYLHVGGARTALFSWLFARNHGGQFILRIEDTDLERSTAESTQAILDGMAWLNLDYDEGPFYQTKRFDRYREVVGHLLEQGKAYRCSCSKERIEAMREEQMQRGEKPQYDGRCRELNLQADVGEHVVRFKSPKQGSVSFDDQVYGTIEVANSELDDLIIARSDGSPTYNFTVVVDDWDMKITHVIRGDDHINNTPRQINILKALDATLPIYAHVPMILGDDGKRLSKRHGAVGVMSYREQGYLPQALLNYLVRLGWSHGDQEIFTREEMVEHFALKAINKSPAAFNTEKLQWLNQHYIKESKPEALVTELQWQLEQMNLDVRHGPRLEEVIIALQERAKTLKEMAEKARYLFEDITEYDQNAVSKHIDDSAKATLQAVHDGLKTLTSWNKEVIDQCVREVGEHLGLKFGQVAQPIRIALTGSTVSPPIDVTIELVGQERALQRLQQAIQQL